LNERGAFAAELSQATLTSFLGGEGPRGIAVRDLTIQKVDRLMQISKDVRAIRIGLHAPSVERSHSDSNGFYHFADGGSAVSSVQAAGVIRSGSISGGGTGSGTAAGT